MSVRLHSLHPPSLVNYVWGISLDAHVCYAVVDLARLLQDNHYSISAEIVGLYY